MYTNDFDALREAWRAAVPFPDPNIEFIRGWLRSAPLADIKDIMLRLQHLYTEGKLAADRPEDHAGRFVSACARRLREQREAAQEVCGFGNVPFGSAPFGQHPDLPAPAQTQTEPVAALEPVPESPARWRQSWTEEALRDANN